MAITTTITSDRVEAHAIIGTRLIRRIEAEGFTNTAGEAEVYAVVYDGLYNNGQIRARVSVQRKDGAFAMLNSNKHTQTIGRVLAVLKQEGVEAAYREANAAAIA